VSSESEANCDLGLESVLPTINVEKIITHHNTMKNISKLINMSSLVLCWIKRNMDFSCPTLSEFDPLLDHLRSVYTTRGKSALITYIKGLRGSLMNYLSGNTIKVPGVGITKDGIPKCFGPLIPYIRKIDHPYHYSVLRMTFTILSIGRAMKDTPRPDYEAITHPFKGVEGYKLPQIQESF
jgi:hypothetical protein